MFISGFEATAPEYSVLKDFEVSFSDGTSEQFVLTNPDGTFRGYELQAPKETTSFRLTMLTFYEDNGDGPLGLAGLAIVGRKLEGE